MKFKIVLFSLLSIVAVVYLMVHDKGLNKPTEYIAVCSGPEQFAGFSNDLSFRSIHPLPVPIQDFQPKGQMIKYAVSDGERANAYFIRSESRSKDYLFVIHEWWGLNEYIKRESDRLYEELGDINIIALDLYDGKVASTREKAMEYMQSVTEERARIIIAGAKTYAGRNADIFTIGWCFGGGWSLQTSIELGNQASGTVMFYGMPEQDVERLKLIKCDVLGLFAAEEQWITPAIVSKFENDMTSINKTLIIKSYQAEHGFANPSNPKFDKEATADANKLAIAFIQERR